MQLDPSFSQIIKRTRQSLRSMQGLEEFHANVSKPLVIEKKSFLGSSEALVSR